MVVLMTEQEALDAYMAQVERWLKHRALASEVGDEITDMEAWLAVADDA